MRPLLFAALLCVSCGGGEGSGAFAVSWQVMNNDQSIDCATGGVVDIEVVTDDGAAVTEEVFPCGDGMATTGSRAPGVYTVTLVALDDAGGVVTTSSDDALIVAGDTTEVEVFLLDVDPEQCDASSCAGGCCDDFGNCIDPPTDNACGIGGAVCDNCAFLDATCNVAEGICVQ